MSTSSLYITKSLPIKARLGSSPVHDMFRLSFSIFLIGALALSASSTTTAAESPANASRSEETNAQEALRAYLQLQEQLHATQLAVEQNRKEARNTAAQTADALDKRLQTIEAALSAQRSRELEAMQNSNQAMQSSNKVMLIVAGAFAAMGFLAMLIMAYFQWRTVNGLAEISAALPSLRGFGHGHPLALGPGDLNVPQIGPAEQSNLRLLGAMEQLEKRIHELEHVSAQPAAKSNSNGPNGRGEPPATAAAGSTTGAPAPWGDPRIRVLLGKGESQLSLDNAEAALSCFEEALKLAPDHTEVLVKKGAALERLQRLDEAIQCYDRAIALDDRMTIAYLQKGGLCNRLERFNEALECYEKALRSQEAARSHQA